MIAYFKKILFLLPITSITLLCSCKQETKEEGYKAYFGGEIINPNSKFVLLCKDNEVIDTIVLDDKNRFLKKYDSLVPGMYTFKHEPEYQQIYFEKNDSLMIRLNTNEFDNSLTFCGRGDEKNNFLMELFLKNEADKNTSFDLYDKDFKTFSKAIEKNYNSSKAFYLRRETEVDWSEDFDLYAKTMLDMHYFTKKEMYPFVHERRTNKKVCKNLPNGYYDFRKQIDFNNEKLTSFSPFVRYLTSMLNNVTCKDNDEKSLENNIKKLHVADSLFTNVKIKNSVLNNIAFMYLLEDQNMMSNKTFLDKYFQLSTDKEKQNEIKKIEESIQHLSPNKLLPNIDLIDANGKSVAVSSLFTKNTVVFFWTSEAKSHLESVHQRATELKSKYPNWDFVSINIDDSDKQWKNLLTKYNFKNTTELHATNFQDIKDKWVITKIHRVMLINSGGKIKNGFVSLFDASFENYLK
ncbi:TlpA family protein disulfide reductase [Flavobacterium sp.]|uniref:TlpA family protein disulfide reductase n=1 Tax=Flavobacterium sp. TaxID=239 RepID=UPI003750115F